MSEHSPAPWEWVRHGDELYSRAAQRPVLYMGGDSDGFKSLRHSEADARLIAAAPDLLEACKELVLWINDEPSSEYSLARSDLLRSARTAIARAEGREKS